MTSQFAASMLRQSILRQSLRFQQRRFASTESAQKKATEALSDAGKTAEKVLEGAKKFLGPVGEKAGNLLGAYKQPLLYNFAVTREVLKQIYIKEGLQPPSIETIKQVYSSLWKQLSSPGALKSVLEGQDLAKLGVYGVQAYGIYKIGEIIGRRSLVGYNIQ